MFSSSFFVCVGGVVTPWVAPFSVTVPDLVYVVLLVPGGFFPHSFCSKKY
jgi:hypothetical protein